jgi:hypothetical protein
MADTYGTGSIAGSQGSTAPKGAFGNGGGPQDLRDGTPPGGNPPNTGSSHGLTPPGQGGVHPLKNGEPDSGNPPNSYSSPLEASALQGGPQGIPGDRAPESGDGTGQ